MDKKQQRYTNLQNGLPVIFTVVTAVIFIVFYVGLHHGDLPLFQVLSSRNLVIYLAALACGAAAFLLTRLICMYLPMSAVRRLQTKELPRRTSVIISAAAGGTLALLLLSRRFFLEYYEYPQRDIPLMSFHLVPKIPALFLLVLETGMLAAVLFSLDRTRFIGYFTWLAYGTSVVLSYYGLLYRSIDKGSGFDVHHGTAFLQSIFNALYNVPFDRFTSGTYGHYGIFYAAVMRLLRLSAGSVFPLIALGGAVTTACCIYVIHSLVKDPKLRIAGALALPVPQTLIYMTNYWQSCPHRAMFPVIVTAWLTFAFQKLDGGIPEGKAGAGILRFFFKKRFSPAFCALIAYLLGLCAIVWNTETGIYCLIITAFAFLVRGWQKHFWYEPYMLIRYFIHAAVCCLSLAGAIGAVHLFNLYCGHKRGLEIIFSLKDFFFPLGMIDGFIGMYVRVDVVFGNRAWIYTLILHLMLLFFALSRTTFFALPAAKADRKIPAAAAAALLGILHFTMYFVHAPYDKMGMCLPTAVIAIAFLCEQFVPEWKGLSPGRDPESIFKRTFGLIGFLTLAAVSAEVLVMGPIALGEREYKAHGKSDIAHLAALYNSVVPPDTFSIGSCADILNYRLHQDPGAHYRDLSDMGIDGNGIPEKIVSDALERDLFAVWQMGNGEEMLTATILERDDRYQLIREIDLGGYPLQLYSRIGELP